MRGKKSSSRLLVSALLCSGVAVGAAGTAGAAPVEVALDYACSTSTGQDLAVTARVGGVLPDDVFGPNTVPYLEYAHIDVDLTLGGPGLRAALGPAAARVDGGSTATLRATMLTPGGPQVSEAALVFAPAVVPATGEVVLRAAGAFPQQWFYPGGEVAIDVDGLALSLRPERVDGSPAGAVEATCEHDPAQEDRLGVLKVENIIIERPTRPTDLRLVATTPTTATISWQAGSWWFATIGYEVHLDGAKVAFVTGKQVTLTGLAPDSQHRVKVVNRDDHGFGSAKSRGLVFATGPAPTSTAHEVAGASRVRGTEVPLTGRARTHVDVEAGSLTADLALDKAVVGIRAGSVDLEFTPVAAASITAEDTGYALTAATTVKVTGMVVGGSPVDVPPTCRTSTPVVLTLHTGLDFRPASGGAFTGAHTLPPLVGCGPHTALINASLPGDGNAVELRLRPAV